MASFPFLNSVVNDDNKKQQQPVAKNRLSQRLRYWFVIEKISRRLVTGF
jgi:hypothetical protein